MPCRRGSYGYVQLGCAVPTSPRKISHAHTLCARFQIPKLTCVRILWFGAFAASWLARRAAARALQVLCSKFATITRCRVVTGPGGKTRGFAFVRAKTREGACRVIAGVNGYPHSHGGVQKYLKVRVLHRRGGAASLCLGDCCGVVRSTPTVPRGIPNPETPRSGILRCNGVCVCVYWLAHRLPTRPRVQSTGVGMCSLGI